jgi:DNA helicase II / ATP-dependent DNA helicase PcrA
MDSVSTINLNPEQQLAVSHFEGPCVVTACPGSGKTRVLTSRVIHLVREKNVSPRNILCLTFTNKAADEMKQRIVAELGDEASTVWVSTFHKLCLALLRKYGELINLSKDFTIYSSNEQEELMAKLARMNDYEMPSKYTLKKMVKAINDFREDTVDFKHHLKELNNVEAEICKQYISTLGQLNAVDFSGMLYQAWLLIKSNKAVQDSLSNRFQFVLVDEFQDTNHIQYDIVKLIAQHANLFVVCDPQQSLYSFRGAKPENIQYIAKHFDDTKTINLPRNYRSRRPILEIAERFIRHNAGAEDVELIAEQGHGPCVTTWVCPDPEVEASRVAYQIMNLKQQHGYNWKDFAVLYRVNSYSRSPEMALRTRSIPYKVVGGFSFFDRSEIKTTLAYMSLLVNPFDTINFARAISNPKRGVGDDSIGKLERIAHQTGAPILEICKTIDKNEQEKIGGKTKTTIMQFAELVEKHRKSLDAGEKISKVTDRFIKESGFYESTKKLSQTEQSDKSRIDNLDEMLSSMVEYENRRPNSSMLDYLHSIQLVSGDLLEDNGKAQEDCVQLLTIHSAKGLEWPCVFMIGVEAGSMPHARAQTQKEFEEERRCCYVGITRGKIHLNLSYCLSRRNRPTGPSIFWEEMFPDGQD